LTVAPAPAAPRPWALGAVTLAGVAGCALTVVMAALSQELVRPALQAVLINWICVPYLIGGLLAWWRRPESRLGPLMIALSLVMASSTLQWSGTPLLHSLGYLLDMMPSAMFLHVYLAFPSGRLTGSPERALVCTGYALAAAVQLLKTGLGADPSNLLTVRAEPDLAQSIERFQLTGMTVVLLLGAALLVARRRHAERPARRWVALTVDAFGVGLVMLAVLFVAGSSRWQAFETIRHVTFAALGLAPVAFLLGLLDARLARSDVGNLLVALHHGATSDLTGLLAAALRDPTLALAYWLPEFGTWADAGGRPVDLPAPGQGRAVRVVRHEGEPLAALIVDRSVEDERELLDAVTAAAGIALANARLQAELRARLQDLHRSRIRVLEAGRTERQRLERDLHDGAQQRLVALRLELAMIGRQLTDTTARARLEEATSEVSASLQELRDLARGLYPAVLTGHGLVVACESLAARATMPVELDVDVPERLSELIEVAAYYVVAECLTNIVKHAGAGSASVRLRADGGSLVIEVADDGTGGADTRAGSGLRGLVDRVEALGGSLQLWSPPGAGTRVRAVLPCG
jgi:signal transduction histidine kinase